MRRPVPRTLAALTRTGTALALALATALALAGCGHSSEPPQVRVVVGSQTVSLRPTQYCTDGTGQRYDVRPPVIQAAPGMPVIFTVPDAVAKQGWAVQVFDQHLQTKIGDVPVAHGKAVFDKITTSDVVPPAFYLVVVEDKGSQCDKLSGAWPVGIIRAGGPVPTSSSPTGMPSGASQG